MQLYKNDLVYRSYENCRRLGVAILDIQMSKVPIISGYAVIFCLIMSRDFQKIKVKVKVELFD
jgi:hypothetical protein